MSSLLIIISCYLIAFFARFVWFRRIGLQRARHIWGAVAVLFFTFGVSLIFIDAGRIKTSIEERGWPTTSGTVIESRVITDRGITAEVIYQYVVNDTSYAVRSELGRPYFGGRINRLSVAESVANQLSRGDTVTVYYRPGHPGTSKLQVGAGWDEYVQLSLGMLLSIAGGTLLLMIMVPAKRSTSKPT